MTSNVGSDRNDNLMGFGQSVKDASKQKVMKALREFLRPEFLARVDEIIVFSPLGEESLTKIAELLLRDLQTALAEKSIETTFEEGVCLSLAKQCEGTGTGARELRNLIRRQIEDPVVNEIVTKGEGAVHQVQISSDTDGKIVVTTK